MATLVDVVREIKAEPLEYVLRDNAGQEFTPDEVIAAYVDEPGQGGECVWSVNYDLSGGLYRLGPDGYLVNAEPLYEVNLALDPGWEEDEKDMAQIAREWAAYDRDPPGS